MKKRIASILLVSCIASAEIDFTRIKGLYSVFRTQEYNSPLFGFAWWNGGQIEKLYRYGDSDHKMVQFIQDLFYLNQADGLTFAPTILPNKVGSYITLGAIGAVIRILNGYIDKKSLHPHEEQHLEKMLEDALEQELEFSARVASSKVEQERMRALRNPEIAQAKNDVIRFEKERVLIDQNRAQAERAVKDFQREMVKISSQRKALEKKKLANTELQIQIRAKEEELQAAHATLEKLQQEAGQAVMKSKAIKASIQHAVDTERLLENRIKNTLLDQGALNKFVKLMVGAFEESLSNNPKYLPFTVQNILLAMLWKKVAIKKDFILYFAKLDPSIFKDSSLLVDGSPTQHTWLEEQYDKKSYQSIAPLLKSIEDEPDLTKRFTLLRNNFELLIASWYSYDVFTSVFPPQVLAGWTNYNGNDFADCGSTAIRNALNNLIYMPIAGTLHISRLLLVFKVNNRITNFYDRFGTVEQILEQKSRDAWVQVTSGLTAGSEDQKIDYKSPIGNGVCEIAARTGIRNINNVMRQLLGINSLNEFSKLPNVQVVEQLGKDPNFGVYTFILNNQYTFKWYFDFYHFFISIEPHYISTDPAISRFMQSIGTFLQYGQLAGMQQDNNMVMALLLLYRDRSSLFMPVMRVLKAGEFPSWYRDQLIIGVFNANSLTQKIDFIRHVLADSVVRIDRGAIDLLKRLMREMINDVEQYYADIVRVIIESSVAQDTAYVYHRDFDDIVRRGMNLIKDNYPNLMPMIIEAILYNKRDKYYGMLKKDTLFTPAQLSMVVKNRAEILYDKVREYLLRIKIPLSNDDHLLIKDIYKARMEDLYPVMEKRIDKSILNMLQAA